MGFQKTWDKSGICNQLQQMSIELNSPYNDGWTSWMVKEELYLIKFELDRILENSPTFTGEEEFLKQHEKQQVWQRLKKV